MLLNILNSRGVAQTTKQLCLFYGQPIHPARKATVPRLHALRAYASKGPIRFAEKGPAGSSKGPSSGPVRLSDLRLADEEVVPQHTGHTSRTRSSENSSTRKRVVSSTESTRESRTKSMPASLQRAPRQAGHLLAGDASSVKGEKEYERAKASAAGSLSLRPHPRKELEEKLMLKGHSPEAIARALDRLAELGMVDDAAYAEIYARSKWRQSKWSPSRIRMELSRKGISRGDMIEGISRVFGDEASCVQVADDLDCEDDQDAQDSASAARLGQQLLEAVMRRAETMTGLPRETRRRRLIGWLQRRGFSWPVVSAILQLLDD